MKLKRDPKMKRKKVNRKLEINIPPIYYSDYDFHIGGVNKEDWEYCLDHMGLEFDEIVKDGLYELILDRIMDLINEKHENESQDKN